MFIRILCTPAFFGPKITELAGGRVKTQPGVSAPKVQAIINQQVKL